jgi:hypothetical protein
VTFEEGPADIDFVAQSNQLTDGGKLAYLNLPLDVKCRIAAVYLAPKKQSIRLIWDHPEKVWDYRQNEIPFVQFGYNNVMKSVAKEFLQPAPILDRKFKYRLLIHYKSAEFVFAYNRCGSRDKDDEEYLKAMSDAASIVKTHNNNPQNPKIRKIHLSFCARVEEPEIILNKFHGTQGLRVVTLMHHDHYKRGSGYDSELRSGDEEEARCFGPFKYKFKVRFSDVDNTPLCWDD